MTLKKANILGFFFYNAQFKVTVTTLNYNHCGLYLICLIFCFLTTVSLLCSNVSIYWTSFYLQSV